MKVYNIYLLAYYAHKSNAFTLKNRKMYLLLYYCEEQRCPWEPSFFYYIIVLQ